MTVISDNFDGGTGLDWTLTAGAEIDAQNLNLTDIAQASIAFQSPVVAPEISLKAFMVWSGDLLDEFGAFGFSMGLQIAGRSASQGYFEFEIVFENYIWNGSPYMQAYSDGAYVGGQFSRQLTAGYLSQWLDITVSIDSVENSTVLVDLDGDGITDLSFYDPALDGFSLDSLKIFSTAGTGSHVSAMIDDVVISGEIDVDPSALSTEELASLTQLWDKLTAVAGAYQTFGTGFGAAFKTLTGTEFLSSAAGASQWLDTRLLNALPDGAQDLLNTLTDTFQGTRDFDDLLAAMRAHKGAGQSLVGLMNQTLKVIEGLDYATTALEAVGAIMNGDIESANGSALELTAALASGAVVSHVVGSTAVTMTAVAIGGTGLGALIVVGGVAVVVGLGTVAAISQLEAQFDLLERIHASQSGMALRLIQMQTDGWVASWFDFAPHPLTARDPLGELLFGRGGNDSLKGIGGEDTLVGSQGDDTLDGGGGADELRGGDDDDLYIVDHAGDRVVEGAFDYWIKDIDTVEASITYTLTRSVDNLTLIGNRALDGTGNGLDNKIIGNSADNTLDGQVGEDTLSGMGGDDFIVLNGGDGAEFLYGGANQDTLYISSLSKGIRVDLTLGHARAIGAFTTVDTISGFEDVIGGLGNDSLIGDAGNNILDGSAGRDTIEGDTGTDTITGGAAKDKLSAGDDLAKDVFVFERVSDLTGGFGRETISQFDLNHDVLDFNLVDANSTRDGDQAFKFADRSAAFSIWAKPLRGGDIEISGDVTGDGRADFVFRLVDLLATGTSSPVTLQGIFVL